MNHKSLRCPICQEELSFFELVEIDTINTITHKSCESKQKIKDSGSLFLIINKYPFFTD